MAITSIPVSGANQQLFYAQLTASSDTTPITPQAQVAAQFSIPAVSNDNNSAGTDTQSQYEEAVRQAALSFKNVYAVSDSEFSIFKDATGKYITRYVSLRDGKVTYIPEPTLIKMSQINGGGNTTRVSINA